MKQFEQTCSNLQGTSTQGFDKLNAKHATLRDLPLAERGDATTQANSLRIVCNSNMRQYKLTF